ncbi:MAG: two pore domain potassium channel family protein [Anaerolineae bacterium]|nr:two pore domain potassium channel family protein [Anaerolineae bacterium]
MRALSGAEMRLILPLVASILVIGTMFYHFIERWDWLDSLYFSVVTLTTVGYGDFSPKTAAGKLFTIGYIITGFGVLALFITTLANRALDLAREELESTNRSDASTE